MGRRPSPCPQTTTNLRGHIVIWRTSLTTTFFLRLVCSMNCTKGEAHQNKSSPRRLTHLKNSFQNPAEETWFLPKIFSSRTVSKTPPLFLPKLYCEGFQLRLQKALRSQQKITTQLQQNNFINPTQTKLQFSEVLQRIFLKYQNGLAKHLRKPILG